MSFQSHISQLRLELFYFSRTRLSFAVIFVCLLRIKHTEAAQASVDRLGNLVVVSQYYTDTE